MISIVNLSAGYGSVKVLDGLNWNLECNLVHGLVGLNGSGKTTLLKTMFGLVRINTGTMTMDGKTFSKRFISMLETEPYFYHGINGREYLSLFNPGAGFHFNAGEWAELFQLPLNELIDSYSTGMRKKLALLGILKSNKPLILLDEPFNGLDMESSRILSAVLKRMRSDGKTIIITSHILETLTGLCDQIHYLKTGVIAKTYQSDNLEGMSKEIFHELDQHIENKIDGLLEI